MSCGCRDCERQIPPCPALTKTCASRANYATARPRSHLDWSAELQLSVFMVLSARSFVQACLTKAAPAPQICTNVPKRSEIIRSAKWAIDECGRRGLAGSQPCGRMMQEVQRYCEKQ